jgi:hypothetical protein
MSQVLPFNWVGEIPTVRGVIAAEIATHQVDLEQFKQMLVESITWHKQTGKQPPAGLGYYKQVALALRKA